MARTLTGYVTGEEMAAQLKAIVDAASAQLPDMGARWSEEPYTQIYVQACSAAVCCGTASPYRAVN